MTFKDHFSSVADTYAAARPEYPDALFDAIADYVPATARVWEPGCGSGQATRGLAARFAHVHATDPSARQIAQHWAAPAYPGMPDTGEIPEGNEAGEGSASPMARDPFHPLTPPTPVASIASVNADRVSVATEAGEHTALADASVELVAVAQALHWFDRDAFFRECERVLVPGGVLAAWGYGDFLAPEGMVDAVDDFRARIEAHWPPERALVDAQYAGFDWPFPELPAPALWLEAEWTLPHFLRYLGSLSAVVACRAATGEDPVARHTAALTAAWGDGDELRTIQWPLFLHLRQKPPNE